MGKTRRVAERMILERSARAREIAEKLRKLATRLEAGDAEANSGRAIKDGVGALRAMADQIERL